MNIERTRNETRARADPEIIPADDSEEQEDNDPAPNPPEDNPDDPVSQQGASQAQPPATTPVSRNLTEREKGERRVKKAGNPSWVRRRRIAKQGAAQERNQSDDIDEVAEEATRNETNRVQDKSEIFTPRPITPT